MDEIMKEVHLAFKIVCVMGLFTAMSAITSLAGAVEPHNMTTKELLFACNSPHDSNDYPVCLVFMGGFSAGATATLKKKPWCEPTSLTEGEEILAFVREMQTYPQLIKEPLPIAVGAALVTAYPCRK